jgi:Ca2+:H+ antiporter
VKRKINLLLLAIPVVLFPERFGLAGANAEGRFPPSTQLVIFALSALSLLPLASLVESAVEELAELLGQFIGGLLHTTFGNVAELVIGISILLASAHGAFKGEIGGPDLVRASIAGAVIRNSLLFLGLATILGTWRNGKMKFDAENASEYSTVFALAVIGLALPTVGNLLGFETFKGAGALAPSLAVAGILLVVYLAYILFAVFRVAETREPAEVRQARREQRHRARQGQALPLPAQPDVQALFEEERRQAEARLAREAGVAVGPALALRDAALPAAAASDRKRIYPSGMRLEAKRQEREERAEEASHGLLAGHPVVRGLVALVTLAVATAGVVIMSEHFVGTIEGVAKEYLGGNELFIGLIVIPVIGGMVELTGAVGMARRNRMEITMAVTAGASIQMILLVAPVLVFVGTLAGAPIDLVFQPLPLAVFVASSFIFMLLGRDGESSWLEGVLLTAFWLLVASTAFFLKG